MPKSALQKARSEVVREHYDRLALLYRILWGEHLHHGFWGFSETLPPMQAQERMIEKIVEFSGIPRGARVLDIGCGVGGSSCWLAEKLGCTVVGINISPVQIRMARESASLKGLEERVEFREMDASRLELGDQRFDAVWVVECAEHLEDKPAFLQKVFARLEPGGTLVMANWLAADELRDETARTRLGQISEAMLCPPLPSAVAWLDWLAAAGFVQCEYREIGKQVAPTWDFCAGLAERPVVRTLATAMGERVSRFVESFSWMREAFAEGWMTYGLIAARKPPRDPA